MMNINNTDDHIIVMTEYVLAYICADQKGKEKRYKWLQNVSLCMCVIVLMYYVYCICRYIYEYYLVW